MSLSDYEHLLAQMREELQASDTESDLEEAISHRAKGLRAPPEIGDAERHVHFAHGIEWSDPSTLLAANGYPGAKRAHIGTQSVATCFRTAALPVTESEYRHMLKTHKRCRKLLEKATPAEIERDKIYTSAMFSESLGACLPPLAKRHAIEAYQLASSLGTADSDLKTNISLPFLVDEQALAASLKKNQQISVELSQQIKDLEELARRKLAEIIALERANQKTSSGRLVTDATSQAQKIMFHIQDREVLLAAKRLQQSHVAKKALAKRLAEECQKEFQRKQVKPSVKNERESLRRAKKMVNEMVIYWKRNERIEKERRKKAERELLEKRKKEEEAREARRQARKFNFLITQTELYAHFMSKKLGNGQSSGSENEILQRLEGAGEDDEEGAETTEDLRNKALQQAQQAVAKTQMRTQQFDAKRKDANGEEASAQDDFDQQFSLANPNMEGLEEIEQPEMLRATLKGYQLKGLRWLSNLYQQGINGILADEMGLGKTIQSIATLGHLAEKENIWGPFLVVAPASTLHNWCNEISKFTPDLKVLPYWGTQGERKVLRGFWNRRRMHRKDADFHVMVTSYEMIVQDSKYLARVDWQYMVLDEAQAIKSSTSARWNTLLKFNCRNRLLLTGTPIQNTMAELWALLHFIMPTLFDSHAEFNEWFSKDIESHAQNSSSKLDQAQLQRLHMILKPFMLRRIKRNVEDELPDKVEIMIQCQLTPRQLRQYRRLKQTLKNKTLPSSSNSEAKAQGARSKSKKAIRSGDDHLASLLNIVMQFRKVCNHPDLLNLRAIRSPLVLALNQPRLGYAKGTQVGTVTASTFCYGLPRIVFDELLHPVLPQSDKEFAARAEEKPMLRSALIERKLRVSHRAELHEGYAESGSLANVLSATSFSLGEMDDMIFYQDRDVLLYELVCAHERERSQYRTIVLHDKSRITVPDMSINNIVRRPRCSWISEVGDDLRESAWLFRRWTMAYPNVLSLCPQMVCASSCFSQQLAANQLGWHNLSKMALFHAPSTENSVVRFPTKALDALPLVPESGLMSFSHYASPSHFISHPDFALFLADCGKLQVLDRLLGDLKANGHRVLIYSQMTRMIDLLEEFMTHRSYTYLRLDGSSKISERRDMVSDFQSRDDIFAFILSTRAGGIGINLTAADTVIFYDSDWNPTVDQQAMDRAHRLGQTRTVTVYRLITKNSVEERILERAQEKSRVHQMVIQGGNYMPEQSDKLKSTEVMAMLLGDDDEDASQADDDEEEEEMVNDDDEDEDVAATGIDVDAAE